jgi:hypothetical protein
MHQQQQMLLPMHEWHQYEQAHAEPQKHQRDPNLIFTLLPIISIDGHTEEIRNYQVRGKFPLFFYSEGKKCLF